MLEVIDPLQQLLLNFRVYACLAHSKLGQDNNNDRYIIVEAVK